jgi:hypothetical protein
MTVLPLWGWSVGDFVSIINLAWQTYHRCQEAGGEYRNFSDLAYTLRNVLKTVKREFQRPGSQLTRRRSDTLPLAETITECEDILLIVRGTLEKYRGFDPRSARSRSRLRRTWDQVRFSIFANVAAELNIQGKRLESRILIILLELDVLQIRSVTQVQTTLDAMRQELNDGRASRHSPLYRIARRVPRIQQESLSDSRHSDISVEEAWSQADEEIWTELRQELIQHGFSRLEIYRHRRVLMAYIKIKGRDGGDVNLATAARRRGRRSPWETGDDQPCRGRREEQSRGRRASRHERSSRRRESRWGSSSSTLIDTPSSRSRSRRHRVLYDRRTAALPSNDKSLLYVGLGAAAAATLIFVTLESGRSSRKSRR